MITLSAALGVYAFFPEPTPDPVVSYIPIASEYSTEESDSSVDEQVSVSSEADPPKKSSGSSSAKNTKASDPAPTLSIELPLNINTATEEEFAQLEGVSPELARVIVHFREAAGGFQSTEDLKKVTNFTVELYWELQDCLICP